MKEARAGKTRPFHFHELSIETLDDNLCRLYSLKMEMDEITEVLSQAKALAKTYKRLTGKPLGITGEVAEFEAARILGLELAGARQSGYDATQTVNGKVIKIQIKGRCIPAKSISGQRLGRLQFDKDWDTVILVLMDEDYEVIYIFEANREEIENVLSAPGSQAKQAERGLHLRCMTNLQS